MLQLDTLVLTLLTVALTGYASAWLLLLAKRRRAGFGLMALAWCVNASLMVVNGYAAGAPPFGNMYHVQVFLALCFLPLYLVLARREKLVWTGPYFAFVAVLPLVGALFMDRDVLWRQMPALQSPWFVPHVVAYMISYALAATAAALSCTGAFRTRRLGQDVGERYAGAGCQILRLAFPFMTFGMLSGALWAEEAWGVYWSWDPKETWSLITWTLYLVYFHCRTSRRLRPYAGLAQGLAFAALLTTFFLVNLLPRLSSALHSYA